MQYEPKNIFKQNGIYVVVEKNLDVMAPGYIKIIGVATSYEDAMKYSGSNRSIEGPVPLLGKSDFEPQPIKVSYPIFKKESEPLYTPPKLLEKNPFEPVKPITNPFQPTKPIDINPFKIPKTHNDFSMLTPPSSRVNSNASSPANDQYF